MKKLAIFPILFLCTTMFAQQHTVILKVVPVVIPAADLAPPVQQPVSVLYTWSRSTISGGPYVSIGTSSVPTFSDSSTTVVPGITLYYVVSCAFVNSTGSSAQSGNSNEAMAVIPGTVPTTNPPVAPTITVTVQ